MRPRPQHDLDGRQRRCRPMLARLLDVCMAWTAQGRTGSTQQGLHPQPWHFNCASSAHRRQLASPSAAACATAQYCCLMTVGCMAAGPWYQAAPSLTCQARHRACHCLCRQRLGRGLLLEMDGKRVWAAVEVLLHVAQGGGAGGQRGRHLPRHAQQHEVPAGLCAAHVLRADLARPRIGGAYSSAGCGAAARDGRRAALPLPDGAQAAKMQLHNAGTAAVVADRHQAGAGNVCRGRRWRGVGRVTWGGVCARVCGLGSPHQKLERHLRGAARQAAA